MQDPTQCLDEVEEKQVKRIEDSQPDLETQPHDLEKAPEHTDLNTPTKESPKEVGTNSLNEHTPSIVRRRFKLSSQQPPENIISVPNKGTQTRSYLKNLCVFSTFIFLVEPKDIK